MARREIWWTRWRGGYRPVSWKAWAWLGAFGCALWPVIAISERLALGAGMANGRSVSAICVIVLFGWGYWFVERHTGKK